MTSVTDFISLRGNLNFLAKLLPSKVFRLCVRNMAWPRIDWEIWFLLVCFYRQKIKCNEKKCLLSSRTWFMS